MMRRFIVGFLIIVVGAVIAFGIWRLMFEKAMLNRIIDRLTQETRRAQILVTGVQYDEATKVNFTTIKFVEYDSFNRPLDPMYFTFRGSVLQIQSLVVRFDDQWVKWGDRLRGKSVALFLKAFALDGTNTQEFIISAVKEVPRGYKVSKNISNYERRFWERFWNLALHEKDRKALGIKNVQIEAPGTIFVPGYLYTLMIEHDGGLRIDTEELPAVFKK